MTPKTRKWLVRGILMGAVICAEFACWSSDPGTQFRWGAQALGLFILAFVVDAFDELTDNG
jgi:hypothetical protein